VAVTWALDGREHGGWLYTPVLIIPQVDNSVHVPAPPNPPARRPRQTKLPPPPHAPSSRAIKPTERGTLLDSKRLELPIGVV
jgi:hypothetical protein